ncbi:MAG: GNAT family N-acetyltransferase [Candidatus Limnocylindrales bacterium]|jgi:ribosomal protein S18 acetylase RimI-like enzyme
MPLPSGPGPWFGLSPETLRFLEVHPVRAISIPGRAWRDFGDSVMLFSAGEKEPFFNRLTAVRWPEDPREFDGRLGQALELFSALERKPYLWIIPGLSTPRDMVSRLTVNGFVDQGGGFDMILLRDPDTARPVELLRGAILERWNGPLEADRPALAEALALVIGESFYIPQVRRESLIAEIGLTLQQPYFHAYLIRVDGEPVATGERYVFDGASYISSIGTRPAWRGRGFGEVITRALARDSIAAGLDLIYLGVYADNARAIRLYERLGFGVLGPRSSDMLLEHPR